MRYLLLILIFNYPAYAEEYSPLKYEIAWQVLHAIDVAQTARIKDYTHLKESHIHTIVGRQPEERDVYAWGLSMAIGHYFVMKWVDENTKYGQFLRGVEIGYKFSAVSHNHQMGIRIKF